MTQTLAENLKKARINADLSMEELAEMLEISKQSVYKFEKGLLTPNPEALNKLTKFLGVKMDQLFGIRKYRLEKISFRSGVEQAMIKLAHIEDEVIEEMELVAELEKLSKDVKVFENPLSKLEIKKMSDVEKAADALREEWNLGEKTPLANVVDVLEDNGITVIHKYSSYNFEGFSAYYKERPVVVLNTRTDEITRRRFTALHELGHILLELIVDERLKDRIEEICNVFASALLLPSKVLQKFWEGRSKFVMQDFIHIKETYGISILAIWISAIKLELLTWDTYNKWKETYEVQTDYGSYKGLEMPKRVESLILRCITSGKMSVEVALEKVKKLKNNLDKTILLNMDYSMAI